MTGFGSVVDATRQEYHSNTAFRLAAIGGLLMLAVTATAAVAAAAMLPPRIAVPAALLFVLNVATVALSLYINYCFQHGKCRVLSLAHGALLLVYGVAGLLVFGYALATAKGGLAGMAKVAASSARR